MAVVLGEWSARSTEPASPAGSLVVHLVYFGGRVQGVISCVQLKQSFDAPDPSGFTARGLNRVRRLSTVLERLVNYRLLTRILNLEI